MEAEPLTYLYRGTTEGWPGNDASQRENRTCATSDPLVATLFAVECRNVGRAIIHVLRIAREQVLDSGNCFATEECERIVRLKPEEFASRAGSAIPVEKALAALASMGVEVPSRLPHGRLTKFLRSETRRLTPDEIALFNRLCGVEENG